MIGRLAWPSAAASCIYDWLSNQADLESARIGRTLVIVAGPAEQAKRVANHLLTEHLNDKDDGRTAVEERNRLSRA